MVYFIAHNDIQSKALELTIASEIKKTDRFIYLTATQNLKKLRADSPLLSQGFTPFKNNNALSNLFSITDFVQYISKQTYESKDYISTADQKYILAKAISFYYKDNPVMQRTMYQMRYDLYELFSLLSFHGKEISKEQLKAIGEDFSVVEEDVFSIYAIYQAVITKMLAYIAHGQIDSELTSVLGENFLKNTKAAQTKTFTDKQKEIFTEFISKTDALFMDGFLFFNEIQRFILSVAIREGKSVYFISKQFSDNTGGFLFERSIKELVDKLSAEITTIEIPCEHEIGNTALDHIKAAFPLSVGNIPSNADVLIPDGSLKFIRPFINREEELRYVAKAISGRLKTVYKGDISGIIRMLNNDIAIVLAIDKENYEERISNIFREVGLFVFEKELLESGGYLDIDTGSFEPVYFNRQEFLDGAIKRVNGEILSYQDKHIFFERCFMRIDINKNSRPIASYPVGQFVLELYRTIIEGISVEGFKSILYSNWRYTVDKVQLRWSDFISDFKYIEIFFENSKDITHWCETANELVLLKAELTGNAMYEYHPLSQVKSESLDFFCSLHLTS